MSWINKPLWSEGLFVKPVHFQQQERYLEHWVSQSQFSLHSCGWGFTELQINTEMLGIGKFALISAAGIMPDGTPFRLPEDAPLPSPVDLPEGIIDQVIYLCLPLKSLNRETAFNAAETGVFRYRGEQVDLKDVTSATAQTDPLLVAKPHFSLLLDNDKRSDYSSLAVAHLIERNKDQQLVLNRRHIEPTLDCRNNSSIQNYLAEVAGLLEHRASNLANRLGASGTGGAAEVADFLMLQTLNRNLPLFRHLAQQSRLHPQDLYRVVVQLVGELATFNDPRLAPRCPVYQHDKLADAFESLFATLKEQLATVIDPRAISLPLKEPRYGIYRAVIPDMSLLQKCAFVLAVKAQVSTEELRRTLPNQIKVASVEKIRDLVVQQLPGIPVKPLPVAPRQLPYHQGFVYFELDKNHPDWAELGTSSGIAFHISGNYTGVELEFWAVKS